MKAHRLYQALQDLYREKKGERFFSFSLLWACLGEKFGFSSAAAFSQAPLPQAEEILSLAHRLLEGYPLQYALGRWEFRGKDYLCREQVLIPREDTALLCQLCESHLPQGGKLLDFCCGSGIVGISVLLNRPDCTAFAADVSPHALRLTEDNARLHRVTERLQIQALDLFSPETEELIQRENISLFASNPPYIPREQVDRLEDNVKHEPRLALEGGEDGLLFYRRILQLSLRFPAIPFLCEMGYDQRPALEQLFSQEGTQASFYQDLCGNDRCFLLQSNKRSSS